MNAKWFVVMIVLVVLAGCSMPASVATPVPNLPQPTPDVRIDALSTKQAQQDEMLAAIATGIAQPKEPVLSKETPIAPAEPVPAVVAPEKSEVKLAEPISKELFLSPVKATETFNEDSKWLIAEPGVLLDNTTAWTIPGTKDTWFSNVPEGAFTYLSLGQGKITIDGYTLDLPYEKGHNYLVVIRGRIDDGIVDTDRNMTAEVTNFVPGHAIWSHMPKGAYVSKDWFLQQLVASTTESYTNCGALGCSHVTVVLLDIDTHFEQRFAVESKNLSNWTKIK
jgi:hypothetical protein